MNYLGTLICRERLRRSWSQEGLCRGICTVSYLSKIESGRAEPSEEVLKMLLARLGLEYSGQKDAEAEKLTESGYELLFSGCYGELEKLITGEQTENYIASSRGLEIELLRRFATGKREAFERELEKCMDSRALALQRILQGRSEEAVLLLPNAYTNYEAGTAAYARGEYVRAIEYLQMAYGLAAKEGSAKLMLLCKLFLGCCCCNRLDMEGMERHYKAARRLALAMGDSEALEQMDYNTAATAIECGKYEESYAYFSKLLQPDMMSLHKLAICCEKTGRSEEAIAALEKAGDMESEYPETELARKLCDVVRYRLEKPDYLSSEAYGELLLGVFERCRRELSMGYAIFHLPWVIEWYKASRQYKKALELMTEFPD